MMETEGQTPEVCTMNKTLLIASAVYWVALLFFLSVNLMHAVDVLFALFPLLLAAWIIAIVRWLIGPRAVKVVPSPRG